MIALAQFLGVVLGGVALVGYAIAIGGVAFVAMVLRQHQGAEWAALRRRSLRFIALAAAVAGAARLSALVPILLAFLAETGAQTASELLSTQYAKATLVQAGMMLGVSAAAWRAASGSTMTRSHPALLVAAALAAIAGAWLTHAASRLENTGLLMTITVVHQLAAALWVGTIAHLVLAHLAIDRQQRKDLWPRLLARASPLAFAAVVLLVVAGTLLATIYVGSWEALVGTGYGAMVMAKLALLALALALGFMNFRAMRHARTGRTEIVESSVPAYVQAELALVVTALLTAASLTSQAPAADVEADRASVAEVVAFFAPKKPLFVPPPRDALLATANATSDVFAVPDTLERAQNNFNHNISGLLVLLVAIGALLHRAFSFRAARHWPLLFLPLAAFVLLYGEPTVWPLGHEPFWATLAVPGVLQHRIAALLVVALAVFEWRVAVGGLSATHWRFAFPVLCVFGGAMLLTHSHTVFATKSEFLIELSHAVLGLLAVVTGVGRWLELRLQGRASRIAGSVWSLSLVAVALVLLFYREG